MVDIQREIINHSVEDVIRILDNEPVKGDMVPGITAVQVMNRVSIAHLSIERALKFLIKEAGGPLVETHDLRQRYQELRGHNPEAAKSLDGAFEAAVRHYCFNPNADNMTHLKTLERYLKVAGSAQAFQDIRYWELTQSLDEILLRRVHLSIHIELLHGLSEILLAPDKPKETVADRVERAVSNAMWPAAKMAYSPGTSEERSINSYIAWLQGFSSKRQALTEAVQKGFQHWRQLHGKRRRRRICDSPRQRRPGGQVLRQHPGRTAQTAQGREPMRGVVGSRERTKRLGQDSGWH